jgi:ribonuclease R
MAKSKKNTLKKQLHNLSDEVLRIYRSSKSEKSYNYKEIAAKLRLTDELERAMVLQVIEKLHGQDILEEVRQGSFRLQRKEALLEGQVSITARGFGFLITEAGEDDVFIPESKLKNALPNDTVQVRVKKSRGGGKREAEVVSIVKRHREYFVGILQLTDRFAFVSPDSKEMGIDIVVPRDKLMGAKSGQKVIVRFIDWPANRDNPLGEITEILGSPGEHDTEMLSIIAEFGFPLHFPPEVIQQAESFSISISDAEIGKRRDMREITTFTIDPDDAKDFDDALSVQRLENGNYEIGVHIADVSHYVTPGSPLDREAFRRATSVYLVDRVVPMLPENLSNMVCSLRPKEDKLTYSAVFEMTLAGEIKSEWFGRTIIHSDHRFTYDQVQEILEQGEGPFRDEINLLNGIAHQLRDDRFRRGSIRFESEELKFKLDENGKPLSVFVKERKDAHMLIEDFMLLANKRVSAYVSALAGGKYRSSFVYRVHDAPDMDRLKSFARFVERFGYEINVGSRKDISASFNKLVEDLEGKDEADIIESMAIRTMAKAIYTTKNIGHYGLAFQHYSHFTSPIRRYPDVLVHRLLDLYMQEASPEQQEKLEKECMHCSERERAATQAERASTKYKQIEMIQHREGETFEGIVGSITDFGFYVVIDYNHCEGLVRYTSMQDDKYFFDEDEFCVVANRSGRRIRLGQKVSVILKKADIRNRQVDFEYVVPTNS